jgi:Uma2 family endonuclease
MNAPFALNTPRRFSVADILALLDKGVIWDQARFELLDGEITPMSPKGPLHEELRVSIARWLRRADAAYDVLAETTLTLDDQSFVEPDWVVYPASIAIRDLKPSDIVLLIEVADSSWAYDITVKAQRYAMAGVQTYWALDARGGVARVHEGPGADGWTLVQDIAAGAALTPPDGLALAPFVLVPPAAP